jgi:hypothetical protein
MAYQDDLIQHAIFLSELNISHEPKQVDLRRAVSAAYYGLFHLLTTEAAQNWKHEGQRDRFAKNVRSWPHEGVFLEDLIAPASYGSRRNSHLLI